VGEAVVEAITWGIVLSVLSVLVAVVPPLWEFVLRDRQRLGYRVQMDTTPNDISTQNAGAWKSLARDGVALKDPSVALLRIENLGLATIDEEDYTSPKGDPVGVTFKFPGRSVAGIAITELSDPALERYFEGEEAGLGTYNTTESGRMVGVVDLPRVTLRRGAHYKVLVVLERTEDGAKETEDPVAIATTRGGVGNGRIRKTESRTGRSRWVVLLVCVLAAACLVEPVLIDRFLRPPPLGCATGRLALVGSTAFEATAGKAATEYNSHCPGANVYFDLSHVESGAGFDYLQSHQGQGPENASVLAFSDGRQTADNPTPGERPVAVIPFTLVANNGVGVTTLTRPQIIDLFTGNVPQWGAVGGPGGLPVKLVGRNFQSGTQQTFQQQLLGRQPEQVANSSDCTNLAPRQLSGDVVSCERQTTPDLLDAVAKTRGAIGYSDVVEAQQHPGVTTVQIEGRDASPDNVKQRLYPFWQTEYAYSYGGEPEPGSLAASFLDYLTKNDGQQVIRSSNDIPCAELPNPKCQP
jgi:phosphate transport system substrate-binding protein